MLNFVYYSVSFILWCWHEVFGFVFGAANATAWVLAIVFLVFTLRAILLQPAIKQVRSMRRLQQALWMWQIAPVTIPLMITAAIATHCTARLSAHQQLSVNAAGTAQSALLTKIAMWVVPLGVLVFGATLPVGLLLYLVSNAMWTLAQQRLVFMLINREEQRPSERLS